MSKEINLSQNKIALVSDKDFPKLNLHKWYADKHGKSYYAVRSIFVSKNKTKKCYMHREILGLSSSNIQIDHKDCNGLNNQRSNLRIASNSENQRNRRSVTNTSSKYKGVSIKSNKENGKTFRYYRARIKINGKESQLGTFPFTIEGERKAAREYNKKAKELFGKFANLNIIK